MAIRYHKQCVKPARRVFDFFRGQGHGAKNAMDLARAECEGLAREWRVQWEDDSDPDLSWMTTRERKDPHEVLCAVLVGPSKSVGYSDVIDSMCGIVDPDRNYARVVEAEMVSDALAEGAAAVESRRRAGIRAAAARKREARKQTTLFQGARRGRR